VASPALAFICSPNLGILDNWLPEEPRIGGYRASNTVSVRLEDIGLVGGVIDAALDAGANQLGPVLTTSPGRRPVARVVPACLAHLAKRLCRSVPGVCFAPPADAIRWKAACIHGPGAVRRRTARRDGSRKGAA
jgi:hypothetical protein